MTETTPTTARPDEARGDYWDEFYARRAGTTRLLPSQFATFVAGELGERHRLVEFGCGNGRDSIFFASYGHEVVGVDGSSAAVEGCQKLASSLGEQAEFLAMAIDDPALPERLGGAQGPTVIYARFFLHAITEQEQSAYFEAARALTSPGDLMAVEYRTIRDQSQQKVTDTHYRRFVNPADFILEAHAEGFGVRYATEGFGFAKYKQDDAYVARCLLERR